MSQLVHVVVPSGIPTNQIFPSFHVRIVQHNKLDKHRHFSSDKIAKEECIKKLEEIDGDNSNTQMVKLNPGAPEDQGVYAAIDLRDGTQRKIAKKALKRKDALTAASL